IHFNSYGYWRSGFIIEQFLGPPAPPWRVDVNIDGKILEMKSAKLTEIKTSKLRFQVTDSKLPAPPPPADSTPSPAPPRVPTIRKLPPGKYALHMDGRPVASGTAAEWDGGVKLTRGPEL